MRGKRTAIPAGHAVWAADPPPGPEAALWLTTPGGRALTLASNVAYEVWVDGAFAGDGGHRCVRGEALADRWEQAAGAREVAVRLHWLGPDAGVTYRLRFDDPFLACLERPAAAWTGAAWEDGLAFLARASGHLARQTAACSGARREVSVVPVERPEWTALVDALEPARWVEVEPALQEARWVTRADVRIEADEEGDEEPLDPEAWAGTRRCLVEWLATRAPRLFCRTYDLGHLALHRVEVAPGPDPVLVCHAEAPRYEDLRTGARVQVALADAAAAGQALAPIGQRGGRFVHVLTPREEPAPAVRAWRREYPLAWRTRRWAPGSAALVAAARANLVACVDGGLVDTCWRERVQWTGDLRMSALALAALADAPEVIDLALHQVADSYDPVEGMVRGAWPTSLGTFMPPYHLAFCLAALEHDPGLARDPAVRAAVLDSVARWRAAHLRDGLVHTPPGWTFTDWEHGQLETLGWALPDGVPHAVVNAWWVEVCDRLGQPSGVETEAFERAFAHEAGYLLVPRDARARRRAQAASGSGPTDAVYGNLPDAPPRTSPHATAAALAAGLGAPERREAALDWLEGEWRAGRLAGRVTPYFGYFVALALGRRSRALQREFVASFYGPEAASLGTISEKGTPDESRAHGWSVAYVHLLAEDES